MRIRMLTMLMGVTIMTVMRKVAGVAMVTAMAMMEMID